MDTNQIDEDLRRCTLTKDPINFVLPLTNALNIVERNRLLEEEL